MKTTNKIYSDEEENEVGPSTTTWDAQSALVLYKWNKSKSRLKIFFQHEFNFCFFF